MKKIGELTSFYGGISSSEKLGAKNTFAFNRSTDFRSEASQVTLLQRTVKDTGSLIQALPMWAEVACNRLFSYDKSGNIYQKDSGSWTLTHSAADSVGNGLAYFKEDRNLYYAQNDTFGRLLEACTGSEYTDNVLGQEGGDPTNTKSLDTESGSSQYAYRADTASLSITGDLSLEHYIDPESLPTTGNTMTLISKWDESVGKSYKFDIATVSNYFGDGGDGALTISTDTTDAPIDSACTGTSGSASLTATNASFAADQVVLIHQTKGTNAGLWERGEISSYTAGTITLKDNLSGTYTSGAQVLVLNQYTNVTVNTGITWTAKAWNGTVGGILAFLASGTVTVTGTITATGKGFRGGAAVSSDTGNQGEGTSGSGTQSHAANANAGGGGGKNQAGGRGSGAGGSNGTQGTNGSASTDGPAIAGNTSGSSDLTTKTFGGSGGAGGYENSGAGGNGGGIIFVSGATTTITGEVVSDGNDGSAADDGGGAGAGGSILIKAQTATLGASLVNANGGTGGAGGVTTGGNGGEGRIHIDYSSAYTGTTSPTLDVSLDTQLGSADGYALRLQVSDDGTNHETLQKEFVPTVGKWDRAQVTWDASLSTATFYLNGTSLGTSIGSMTAIHDNASKFAICANFDGAGTVENLYDGLSDDIRVWNDVRTATELVNYNDRKLLGTEPNLIAYYEVESDLTDSQTSGLNDLTQSGTPTYSDDVPFVGLTTRADIDQSNTTGGFAGTYALEVAIAETDSKLILMTPTIDPQKSFLVKIAAKGTGDWTLTVHDPKNRTVATSTILIANLSNDYTEFSWASEWRPIIGVQYHVHITSTVADGTVNVKTGETTLSHASDGTVYAYYEGYFQFLVSDKYHPMLQFLNFLAIGNERYVAKLEGGDTYSANKITLPSSERVRSLGFWREYLAIGTWSGTNIYDREDGKIFFWDGISDTYNFWINVPEGGINSMWGTRDILYVSAGYQGKILAYTGGGSAQKLKDIPLVGKDNYIEIAPGAMGMWQTLLLVGSNLLTDSTTVHQGVYTYGTLNKDYPDSFGFDYPLSVGDQTSTQTKIGMVKSLGQDLYIGWQNGTAYGIDKVSISGDPYPTGTIEFLISDLAGISTESLPVTLRADFEPLNDGESVEIKYKADRESSWKTIDTQSDENDMVARATISRRMKEMQFAVDLATTTTTSPTLLGVTVEVEGGNERRV